MARKMARSSQSKALYFLSAAENLQEKKAIDTRSQSEAAPAGHRDAGRSCGVRVMQKCGGSDG